MRAEQHRDAKLALQDSRQLDHRTLMMWIKTDQGFIQQQQARAAEQCLGQQQALSLAAGRFRERATGKLRCPDHLQRPSHVAVRP